MTTQRLTYFLIFLVALSTSCQKAQLANVPDYTLSEEIPPIDKTREARMLSAFFGLDNGLNQLSRLIWKEAPGKDGMPIVFSHEIDPSTVDISDFQILTQKGDTMGVEFVSYKPAVEEFELRTLLLIGEYGNTPDNEPIEVEIVGELISRDGQNLQGQKIAVTPLAEGPFVSYAEYFFLDEDYPYVDKGVGCDCPKSETEMVVRVVWSGGVRNKDGDELGDAELSRFHISLVQNGDTIEVSPFMLADLNDNENNTDLCLKKAGIPISVRVDANTAIDPNDDINPETLAKVVSRW
ncbi:MAG: hypothetical protein AAF388_25950 [Bacteroidota bacterium]